MNGNNMSFEAFTEVAQAEIKSYLPDEYKDADITVRQMQKMNETYKGMSVAKKGQIAVPNINLDQHYKDYVSGWSLEESLRRMAEQVQMELPEVQTGWLHDYEQVKQHLFIRVCDAKENEAFLSMSPHKETDGLAISYHIAFEGLGGVKASTPVSYKMMEMYDVTATQLHADAVENSQRMNPEVYNSLGNIMMGIIGGIDVDPEMMPPVEESGNPQVMVLTNEQSMYGASALFYPGRIEAIAADMRGDYFILPSSVHEVLLMPDDGQTDYRGLEMMVQQINAMDVAPEDRLSDHVYHYDAAEHVLEKAETFEQRKEEKEKLQQMAADKETERSGKERQGSEHSYRSLPEEERSPERKSVLKRLNEKKEQVKLQPKKDVPDRHREASID